MNINTDNTYTTHEHKIFPVTFNISNAFPATLFINIKYRIRTHVKIKQHTVKSAYKEHIGTTNICSLYPEFLINVY